MVWLNALVGILLAGSYILAAIRIWHRRSKLWSLIAFANALAYSVPTAVYVHHAFTGVPQPAGDPVGLVLFVLPALLILRFVTWGIQDEADAREMVEHIGDA